MNEARSITLPAPVGGWNTRDALDGMNPVYCLRLKNLIPQPSALVLRKGYAEFAAISSSSPVCSLFEHISKAGARSLIAATDNKLFNATAGGDGVDTGITATSNYWQGFQFNGVLLLANGEDQPQQWSGATMTDATYTGISDDSVLIQGTAYRNRVYWVQKDSTSIWYGGVNAITGALTELDVAPLLQRGGRVEFVTTWTRESGTALTELLVVCSSMGEVLVYSGAFPDGNAWSLVGHVFLPEPLGRRAFLQRGADVEILTRGGLVSLANVVSSSDVAVEVRQYAGAIQPTFAESARLYGANAGWEACYGDNDLLLYNIPISNTVFEQYVRNAQTGAWCRFTELPAQCWSNFNNSLYFGAAGGKIYKYGTAQSDNEAAIPMELKLSYNYAGNREQSKHFQAIRPIVKTDMPLTFTLGLDCDFIEKVHTNTTELLATATADWDTATWDEDYWGGLEYVTKWIDVRGEGRAASLVIQGSYKNVTMEFSAFHLRYTPGGLL